MTFAESSLIYAAILSENDIHEEEWQLYELSQKYLTYVLYEIEIN